jgi:hypothetical protein
VHLGERLRPRSAIGSGGQGEGPLVRLIGVSSAAGGAQQPAPTVRRHGREPLRRRAGPLDDSVHLVARGEGVGQATAITEGHDASEPAVELGEGMGETRAIDEGAIGEHDPFGRAPLVHPRLREPDVEHTLNGWGRRSIAPAVPLLGRSPEPWRTRPPTARHDANRAGSSPARATPASANERASS